MFWSKNKKNIKKISAKIFQVFLAQNNLCLLHGEVFVMELFEYLTALSSAGVSESSLLSGLSRMSEIILKEITTD